MVSKSHDSDMQSRQYTKNIGEASLYINLINHIISLIFHITLFYYRYFTTTISPSNCDINYNRSILIPDL